MAIKTLLPSAGEHDSNIKFNVFLQRGTFYVMMFVILRWRHSQQHFRIVLLWCECYLHYLLLLNLFFQNACLVFPNHDICWRLLPVNFLHQIISIRVFGVVSKEEIIWLLLFSLTPDGGEEPTDVDWKMVNRFFDNFCADSVKKSNWLERKSFWSNTEKF